MEIKTNSASFLEQLLSLRTQVIGSEEYGASRLALLMIRRLKLDQILSTSKTKWREDVLRFTIKKLIIESSDQLIEPATFFDDSSRKALIKLISKKDHIEKQLALKHLKDRTACLIDVTGWEMELGADDFRGGLLTNQEGCPLGSVIFPENQKRFHDHIKAIMDNYDLKSLVVISNYQETKVENTVFIAPSESSHPYYKSRKIFNGISVNKNIYRHLPLSAIYLLALLIAYVEWHMIKKLDDYAILNKNSELGTLGNVLEKLKTIRSQTIQLGAIHVDEVKNELDDEQREIIAAFGFTPEEFFT